jgi:riboflavin synthase
MFTGIVEAVGKVVSIEDQRGTRRLKVAAERVVNDLQIGDSVAVSGVCLTVVERDETSFSADLAEETWKRTSFSGIKVGSSVNLELAMRTDARLDGHVVQGHVDGTGRFLGSSEIPDAQDRWIQIEVPSELEHLLVYKGSVAIEGVSLTVAKLESNVLTIAVIPHTLLETNLSKLKSGDVVNIETDILARYFKKWSANGAILRTPGELTVYPKSVASDARYAIVVSNFNKLITDRLLSEAIETLSSQNVPSEKIEIVSVPGAYEIPITAKLLAQSGKFSAIICLGCVIRGETYHFEVISNEVARGVGQSALETRVPHAFGVITCDTQEQALARVGLKSGNIGSEAAFSALAMSQMCSRVI